MPGHHSRIMASNAVASVEKKKGKEEGEIRAGEDSPGPLIDLFCQFNHSQNITESPAFDSHSFVKRLTKAEMPEPQARVLDEEQSRLFEYKLAGKQDIAEFRAATKPDMKQFKPRLKRDIEASRLATTAYMTAGYLRI